MKIPAITSLICECWEEAEESVRKLLATRYLDEDEEFITKLFHGEFRVVVNEASETGRVREAFRKDVTAAFPQLRHSREMDRVGAGIRATTTLHPREVEAKTGGDLGIVLVRPNLMPRMYDQSIMIDTDHQRGLLCQAKIEQRSGLHSSRIWGRLTANQKINLRHQLDYLALILYRYTDSKRNDLAPFHWQICKGASIDSVQEWLYTSVFPSLMFSMDVISLLGNDEIGTDDKRIIREYICPEVRPTLVIHIGWPPGDPPPSPIRLWQSHQCNQAVLTQRA